MAIVSTGSNVTSGTYTLLKTTIVNEASRRKLSSRFTEFTSTYSAGEIITAADYNELLLYANRLNAWVSFPSKVYSFNGTTSDLHNLFYNDSITKFTGFWNNAGSQDAGASFAPVTKAGYFVLKIPDAGVNKTGFSSVASRFFGDAWTIDADTVSNSAKDLACTFEIYDGTPPPGGDLVTPPPVAVGDTITANQLNLLHDALTSASVQPLYAQFPRTAFSVTFTHTGMYRGQYATVNAHVSGTNLIIDRLYLVTGYCNQTFTWYNFTVPISISTNSLGQSCETVSWTFNAHRSCCRGNQANCGIYTKMSALYTGVEGTGYNTYADQSGC